MWTALRTVIVAAAACTQPSSRPLVMNTSAPFYLQRAGSLLTGRPFALLTHLRKIAARRVRSRIESNGALQMIDPFVESSLKSEYEPEIVMCLAVARIELDRSRKVRGCFRVRAPRCERRANVPVSRGVVRLQLQRPAKFLNGGIEIAFLGVRQAQHVVCVRRLGHDGAEIRTAGDDAVFGLEQPARLRNLLSRCAVCQRE